MDKKIEKLFKATALSASDAELVHHLSAIIEWQTKLSTINVDNVEPMFNVLIDQNLTQHDDKIAPTEDNILKYLPLNSNNFFTVPKVLGNESEDE